MNELNKNQLILLVLLVSFVTSIGTGIITTTLLQEAPAGVTQIINRVVERTIEQVTPAKIGEPRPKEKQVTVVVKEEDQVIGAIAKNAKSIVRIKDNALVDGVSPFYGMGMLVDKGGLVVSGKRDNANTATSYSATFADGTVYTMKYLGPDDANGISFFKILLESNRTISAEPAAFSGAAPQLGQSAITLDGIEKNSVSIGRITSISDPQANGKDIGIIDTDIGVKAKTIGGPLLNLSGEIIGLRTVFTDTEQSFIASALVQKLIPEYLKK